MSITQLASTFLGNQRESKRGATDIKTTKDNILHILDDNVIQDVITAKHAIDSKHFKSLVDNVETLDFEVLGGRSYDEHLKKGNRIIAPGEDNELVEFTIDDVDDRRSTHKTLEVRCYASYLDLTKANAIEPFKRKGTAREHLQYALANTDYVVGLVESDREITITFEEWTNPYEYARRVAREFELELSFRIEHNGVQVTNRILDALDRVGAWRGREITFGKDLQEINRLESGDIYTALIGLGPEREDGTRLQVLVEDEEALQRWGRPKHDPKHLIGVYEPQSDREDMTLSELRQYTKTELDKRKNSVINYEISFLDLENLLGDENKKIRFGDTIRIKDTMFEPHLYVEARIFEMTRNVFVPEQKEYVLGDFVEYDEEEIRSLYDALKRELVKKASVKRLLEYAEPKKIESDTPPEIKDGENPIWVDTSKTPHVPYVANAGEWVRMSPTEPKDIGAYTKKEVDDKTEQALKDAKVYSENADNIKKGIIDVGAVPLRTSQTGARIEWDGVNGLVQYDQQGRTTSQIDLDGNARFANAFVTGRVEATEGYFGKNKRVTIGDDGLTIKRPDGAVWMQDGLVYADYSINGYDPYMMDFGEMLDGGTYSNEFKAWNDMLFGNWYTAVNGTLDGRGQEGFIYEYRDIRDPDKSYTVRFQRYEFIHVARYLKFDYQIAINSKVRRHRVLFDEITPVPVGANPIQTLITYEDGDRGLKNIVIDLGKPSYERRSFDFRIGWLRNGGDWGDRTSITRFRIPRISQSDYID